MRSGSRLIAARRRRMAVGAVPGHHERCHAGPFSARPELRRQSHRPRTDFRRSRRSCCARRLSPSDLGSATAVGRLGQGLAEAGVSVTQARSAAGLAQLDPATTHGMSVVLGAGNITSIAVLDTLYELIAHNRVVILKLNPVLGEMFDAINAVLRPLSERGFVEVVRGGVEVGSYLVDHPNVAHVHITGSSASHDASSSAPARKARPVAGPAYRSSARPSPVNSAAYHPPSSSPPGGRPRTSVSRRSTWPPSVCTTAATTASPPRLP